MNQDILFFVAGFSDRETLGAICRVSQAAHRVASQRLYRDVRVRSCDELSAVQGALARNPSLLKHVIGFYFDRSFTTGMLSSPRALNSAGLRVRAFIDDVLPKLANLDSFALDCSRFRPDLRVILAARLAALPRLHSVKVPAIGVDNLRVFRASRTVLEHVSIHEHQQRGLHEWLSDHSATLRSLHVAVCGMLIEALVHTNTIFPHLHTLALSGNFTKLTARCGHAFPAVRSLSDQRPLPGAADAWPLIEHLDASMHDVADEDRARPYSPTVRSLRLKHTGPGLPERLEDWASPQITALALVFSEFSTGGFAAHATALSAFSGLRMLDITLQGDQSETDTDIWVHKAASSLSVVPPHLEVLTLRGTTGLHDPPANPLDTIRQSVLTLRLLRIVLQQPPQRLAFAHPRPIDWLTACEMVADYLPHWRETRAPWEDIRDI